MKRVFVIFSIILIVPVKPIARTLRIEPNQRINKDALRGRTLTELIILRNSIFANYGYVFKSTALNEYYLSLSWYEPNRNFSFNSLSAVDRKNVQLIRSIELKKISSLKKELTTISCKKMKYFLEMRITRTIPHSTQKAIMDYLHDHKINTEITIPNFLSLKLLHEKSRAEMDSIIQDAIEHDRTAAYRVAHFDNNGILRILQYCYADSISGKRCPLRYYFDQNGKITIIRGSVSQTTVDYEWYFSYLRDKIISMTLTVTYHGDFRKKVETFYL